MFFTTFDLQVKNPSNIDVKRLFIASMKRAYDFSYEDGHPFLISLSNEKFYVLLKSVSSACFKNRPDITRVQLHFNQSFEKIIKAKIPFIILGYDAVNDVFVNWNPDEVKERLNAKRVISLYSRQSIQDSVKGKNFKEGTLTNGGKIIAFKRNLLLDFFRDWKNIFDFEETNTVVKKPTNHEDEKVNNDPNKITEITDKEVINQMLPLLKGNRVLEAATLCHKHYSAKYKGMKIKDWLDIANDMYKSIGKN